jgi:hypothetical protein
MTDISGAVWSVGPTDPGHVEHSTFKADDSPSALRQRLEWRVYNVCLKFCAVGAHDTDIMTVPFFMEQLPGTSSGAIDSVLKRWERIGFACLRKKPTRFTGFTPEGTVGLEEFLRKHKRISRTR